MWVYEQATGQLIRSDGEIVGTGYAGRGEYKNQPSAQHVHDEGPLPCGIYFMQAPVDTKTHGPYVIWLTPKETNEMFGRSGFGMHGDSVIDPGTASDGCIVQV